MKTEKKAACVLLSKHLLQGETCHEISLQYVLEECHPKRYNIKIIFKRNINPKKKEGIYTKVTDLDKHPQNRKLLV